MLQLNHADSLSVLIDAINELFDIGLEIDFPRLEIAMIRDHSFGKSSIMERLSGIPFPSDKIKAIRFPLQIIMNRTPEGSNWRGVVKVV